MHNGRRDGGAKALPHRIPGLQPPGRGGGLCDHGGGLRSSTVAYAIAVLGATAFVGQRVRGPDRERALGGPASHSVNP